MRSINLKKGSGEYIAFSVIAPMICFIVILLCAYIQLFTSLRDLNNALTVASRSAAVCTSIEDAESQALLVAESSIISDKISDIEIDIQYAEGYQEWTNGSLIIVKISANINTVAPYITEGRRYKSMIVTIENSN